MGKAQRGELKQALREKKFEKLDNQNKKDHGDKFTQSRKDKLKKEWSEKNSQPWPSTQKIDPKTNKEIKVDHQAHHIIPQEVGGPHAWWNMHPVPSSQHQGGVHGSNAPLNQLLKPVRDAAKNNTQPAAQSPVQSSQTTGQK